MCADLLQAQSFAPSAKDLHSNNLESKDASLTAVKISLLPSAFGHFDRNPHVALYPLFMLRLL